MDTFLDQSPETEEEKKGSEFSQAFKSKKDKKKE
jgi:hypothetical protein